MDRARQAHRQRPGTLYEVRVEDLLPPVQALHVGALAVEALRDGLPVLAAVVRDRAPQDLILRVEVMGTMRWQLRGEERPWPFCGVLSATRSPTAEIGRHSEVRYLMARRHMQAGATEQCRRFHGAD